LSSAALGRKHCLERRKKAKFVVDDAADLNKQIHYSDAPPRPSYADVTITGRPDWANFRLLADSLLWAVFCNITEVARFLAAFSAFNAVD
jgi:hypothetical protein